MWRTAAEWHAALNHLPPALLLASVGFDIAGRLTRRESLQAAGFWTLLAGVAGAAAAIASGLIAERSIEHGDQVHAVMQRHETIAISTGVLFGILAVWRVWRRSRFTAEEWGPYLVASGVGALALVFTAHLGGTIVYRHGGGIPTAVLRSALDERGAHDHAAPDSASKTGTVDSTRSAGQTGDSAVAHPHAPGTPPHRH